MNKYKISNKLAFYVPPNARSLSYASVPRHCGAVSKQNHSVRALHRAVSQEYHKSNMILTSASLPLPRLVDAKLRED